MKIDHMAVYVTDLEQVKAFYQTYFDAESNQMYHNPKTGLKTYFLTFRDGGRLEIMTKPDLVSSEKDFKSTGYIHLAFRVDGNDAVDQLTSRLKADGYPIFSEPRTTGDGYYESCVLDPEGNQVEIIA